MKKFTPAQVQLSSLMSFLGQQLADEYETKVGKIRDTTLTFYDQGREITINISIKDLLAPICNAAELFEPQEPTPPTINVTSVTLDKTTEVLEITGSSSSPTYEEIQLTATILPDNANDKTVTWSSSDEAIATVSETGLVKAVSAGDVVITVSTNDGGHTATCSITVDDVTT